MTTVTHALAPIILVKLFRLKNDTLSKYDYLWIAISGGLADVINPHIYLKDRLTSWSHGLPFWVVFSLLLLILSVCLKKTFRFQVAIFCSFAYLLHLFCDGISGGINLFYPVQNYFWGMTLVPFKYWIPLDVLNLVLVYYLFRWRRLRSGEI